MYLINIFYAFLSFKSIEFKNNVIKILKERTCYGKIINMIINNLFFERSSVYA